VQRRGPPLADARFSRGLGTGTCRSKTGAVVRHHDDEGRLTRDGAVGAAALVSAAPHREALAIPLRNQHVCFGSSRAVGPVVR